MTTHRIITRELLRQWDACWKDEEIAERVPPEGVHIIRILDADDVDILDRIWVGVRAIPALCVRDWR